MKLSINLLIAAMMVMSLTIFHLEAIAQEEKNDVIVKLDGSKMEGKVTSIGSSSIKFKYAGEDLEYEVNKDEINKIEFASGRTETINEPAAPSAVPTASQRPASTPEDRRNKLAVLPFQIITNDQGMMVDALRSKAQNECANSFRKNTSLISVQDPMITNSILEQNGIDGHHLATAANPQEIAVLLGVEYVVFGSTDIENKGAVTTGSAYSTEKEKEKNRKETKTTTYSGGSATTTINYDCSVSLKVFSDQGSNVYADSREAFGNDSDSYVNSLNYMVKRTPWGKKHK
ncbi:hypothetical protein DN752_05915 [Echinicola strongylocentroti]|uniref:Uncharacterized protein n=1 Tax=Echinicola strongylocentroti TaxID=1795355 RepID=A0A2Z4IFN4_9BACT|nr:hypothetical protein [Echinicola strongylocentroti]AWW29695.1 hypothetical protein DN752_05915 [Echinicola strongylocentroti]